MDWYFHCQSILWTILLTPIVVTLILFILPLIVLSFGYVSAIYLKAYRYYFKINGYTFTPECWEAARSALAYLWDAQARFWYGYETEGFENVPEDGPALFVVYHGALNVDWYYFIANVFIQKNRVVYGVYDRFIFKVPGFDALHDCLLMSPGTIESCADILKKGNLLAIAPGGAREAYFGDETYPLIWGTRKGFAKVAIEAKVPIIPVFTENIREAFFTVSFVRNWFRDIYERTRLLIVPLFGGLPVKLKTIVGEPIQYDPEITPEELVSKVADRMKSMIKQHQQLPGSVSRSILQRIHHLFKKQTVKCA